MLSGDLGGAEFLGQAVGSWLEIVVWNSILGALQMAMHIVALDGGVLHLPGLDLVQQIGVTDIRCLCPCWCFSAPRSKAA